MQYSNNLITDLIDFVNKDDYLSSMGIAIRAYDTVGLPVPINETYFSFSCRENSTIFGEGAENSPLTKNKLTIQMSCYSPIKKSAFSAHNLTEKIVDGIASEFSENITSFSIGETRYDDDVKSYKIIASIYFQFTE